MNTTTHLAPLVSDYLIWSLTTLILLSLGLGWRDPLRRDFWRRVLQRNSATAALVVLVAFATVGLADSVHLRDRLPPVQGGTPQSPQQAHYGARYSLLDLWLGQLRHRLERTYSAPLAITSYSHETVVDQLGQRRQIKPRLRYGGAHLTDTSQHLRDIGHRILRGLGTGALWSMALYLLLLAGLWIRSIGQRSGRDTNHSHWWRVTGHGRGQQPFAWRGLLLTTTLLLILGAVGAELAQGYHLLGTDKVGQDVLYLTLKSVRTGLLIGVLTIGAMLPLALTLGIAAGYFGGRIDDLIQYLYTTLASIPGVLLISAAVLSLQVYMDSHTTAAMDLAERADLRLLLLCLILGITGWITLCRLLRGEALKLRESDYVTAARALGSGHLRILVRHLLPNTLHIVLISVILDFSGLVLAEAVLSYVGVGVDPSMISWGNMINSARLELAREPVVWWSLLAALVAMFSLVLAANVMADALRDAHDPRMARQ